MYVRHDVDSSEAPDGPEDRIAKRTAHPCADDRQFRDAQSLDAVTASAQRPGLSPAQIVAAVAEGYRDRAALGERARELQTGRTTVELLSGFDTITSCELWDRIATVASLYLGAVSVPPQTGAPVARLAAIIAEIRPRALATTHWSPLLTSSTMPLRSCWGGTVPGCLVVDNEPLDDDQDEKFHRARHRLADAGDPVTVDSLISMLDRGKGSPRAPISVPESEDALGLLLSASRGGSAA
jgi:fatty acid CoA ligase FadD9